jgi:hypothetical protein
MVILANRSLDAIIIIQVCPQKSAATYILTGVTQADNYLQCQQALRPAVIHRYRPLGYLLRHSDLQIVC